MLEGVRFAYPGRPEPVLAGLDLRLDPGETVVLVGTSGAGKSTLASLLLRLADPDAGEIRCGAAPLARVGTADWRRRVAWIPQRPTIFAGTLAENVTLSEPGAGSERVLAALEQAGASRFVAELPDGIDTLVGEGGRRLSAGQAQRVALARAFLSDPALVVLDEPTAHLDPATAASVSAAIGRLLAGRTALLIAHRPDLVAAIERDGARVAELRGGRIAVPAPPSRPAADLEPIGAVA